MEGARELLGKLENGRAVRTDNLCGEVPNLGLTEDSAILEGLRNLELTMWGQEGVPQERNSSIGGEHFVPRKNWPSGV